MINKGMKTQIKNFKIFELIFGIFLFLVLIFGRNFTGIYIFNYRIGELIVGIQIILFHYFIFSSNEKYFKYILISILSLFYLKAFYVIFDIKDLNILRFSSSIWSISMFFLGKEIFFNKKVYLNLLGLSLIFLYLFTYINYPEILINIFSNYGDKFDFAKPSDLFLIFCITLFFSYKQLNFRSFTLILISSSFFYIPILFNQSRGTNVSLLCLFLLTILYTIFKRFNLIFNLRKILILIILTSFFIGFTLQNLNEATFTNEVIESNIFTLEVEKKESIGNAFYIDRGFLYSNDENTNWRLTIWQTAIKDMFKENLWLVGFPIHQEIPIMRHPYYKTIFLENYNLHNFFVQFFAYFGFLGIFLIISFFYLIIKKYIYIHKSIDILLVMIPIFLVSSFDSSMESVRFPLIFYFSLGLLINTKS